MTDLLARLQAALGPAYRVEQELGGGGMSRVFLAQERELERQVVVKVLPPEMAAGVNAERFRREIQLAASLQHPHIVPLLAAGHSDDLVYYTMPLIEGKSLRAKLAREGELPINETVRILRDVADALAYAHAHGVAHRDIKPDNVLISGPHAVVTDFGVAKALSESTGKSSVTSAGVALGTPAYMAPEQAAADPHTDHRCDLYAVGALGYEMLTGRPPFTGATPQHVLAAQVTEAPEPVTKRRATVPSALAALVMRCLEKSPADRWQTAAELLAQLEGMTTPSGGTVPVAAVAIRPGRRLRGAAVGALAILVLGGIWVLSQRRAPRAAPGTQPGIAVLPFRVASSELALWREGLVDLLAINLDGAAGLRALDPGTLLSLWHRDIGRERDAADEAGALSVARKAGARYAVLGSMVGGGGGVRLTAQVYDLVDEERLGVAQVEGSPDSVLGLVDRLSLQILGSGLIRSSTPEVRRANLEDLTTTSLRALKSYLEGESLFRRSDFKGAIAAYTQAIGADSSFALAFYRLAEAHAWKGTFESKWVAQYTEHAARLADRLPERQAPLVRALLALQRGTLDGIEILREMVRKYPDDAEAWYLLGDTYFHLGSQGLIQQEESERALSRAVELDPGFTPAYIHLIGIALNLYADSGRASRLVETYGGLAPGTEYDRSNRLAFALAFGDSTVRSRARASLDSLPPHSLEVVSWSLLHPRFLTAQREVLTALRRRPDTPEGARAMINLFVNSVQRGKLQEALTSVDDPLVPEWFRGMALYTLYVKGIPVAPDRMERELALGAADSLPEVKSFYRGAYAADRGKWADHEAALARLRGYARRFRAAGDSTSARFFGGAAQALEGYAFWRRDRKEEAVRLLEGARRQATGYEIRFGVNGTIRFWLWKLLLEVGRPREAQRYFDFFGQDFLRPYSVG